MRTLRLALLLLGAALLLSACAAGPNPELGTAVTEGGQPAGFWLGVWHGIVSPVTFVISLFNDNVSLYEVHNSGNWYDFGFVLGLGVISGGPFGASKARS